MVDCMDKNVGKIMKHLQEIDELDGEWFDYAQLTIRHDGAFLVGQRGGGGCDRFVVSIHSTLTHRGLADHGTGHHADRAQVFQQ